MWMTSPSRCTHPRHAIMLADSTTRRCSSNRLDQIPEAELEARIPPHAQDDDLGVEVPSLEQLTQTQEPGHRAALKVIGSPGTIPEPPFCTRAKWDIHLFGTAAIAPTGICWHVSRLGRSITPSPFTRNAR